MDISRGRFITLEGGEGAGKSTQARLLAGALAASGVPALRTREPGGAPGAETIRRLLLGEAPAGGGWDPVTECLLHFAARREHLVRSVLPALEAGIWVVSDRFADSTFAYQVFGQGVAPEVFAGIAGAALGGVRPDLTLVLEVEPGLGLARAAARGDANRYEAMGEGFHARVRAGFRAIAAAEPERCLVLDASGGVEVVAAAVLAAVRGRFGP